MTKEYERNRDQQITAFLKGGGDTNIRKTNNHLDDSYLDEFTPLEIKVYGNNFDRAFKTFRSMVQKDRILSLFKTKQSYEKPSVKKRRKRNEMQQKRMELEAKQQKILSGEFEKELLKKQKLKDFKRQMRAERTTNNLSE